MVAHAWQEMGYRTNALRILVKAEEVAARIADPETQAQTFRIVVEGLLASSAWQEAERVAHMITDPKIQVEMLRTVIDELVASSAWQEAERVANSLVHAGEQARLFVEFALLPRGRIESLPYPLLHRALTLNQTLSQQERKEIAARISESLSLLPVTADLIAFVQSAWLQATTRDELLALLPLATPLIRANPALGMQLVEGMQWVDDFLKGRCSGTDQRRSEGEEHIVNYALECHDSEVANITQDGEVVTLVLDPAYVHKSVGQPGVDAGSGWTQVVQIVLRGVRDALVLPELPCELSTGSLNANGTHPSR